MKIGYSAEERLRVRETFQCIDCGARLQPDQVSIGRIFCRKCWAPKKDYLEAFRPELCVLCAADGVERKNKEGYGGCDEHISHISALFDKCTEARKRVEEDMKKMREEGKNGEEY